MIRILTSFILILQAMIMIGQAEQFDYLKIGLTSEANPMAETLRENYEKEFYYNLSNTVFIKRSNDDIELQFYDSAKKISRIYLRIKNQMYVWEDPILTDERYNELSEEERKELPKFYTITRDEAKKIEGFNCFKVVMKDPEDTEGNAAVEMYVTEQLPNLPIHFPLSSSILSAEPLELSMNLFGTKISFGIVSHESGVNIYNQLNLALDHAIKIDQKKYDELKL